jgi:UDP-3-O-[3-hydroxymyristoyl] N-acetylglucosamine deacetylase
MGVTDAEIEVEGGELPAADGCSLPYCVEIQRVGLADCGELTVEGPYARVFKQELPSKYAVGVGEGWWRAAYLREESFIGRQEVELAWSPEIYIREIAPARTFVLEEELDMARAAGLGKGLSESSCLLIKADSYGNSARFTDEPARHKLLDVIGDLALTGIPIAHLDVVAEFTGHQLNVRVAQKLALDVKLTRR